MDIFNGNRRLEEAIMYSLDWGVFLRHNLNEQIAPFMYLFNGEEIQKRALITDGDPVEYAKRILEKEEKTFQQFVVGMEGYLIDDNDKKIDSIIVQGFDKTQEKGVALGQMFEPKEKNGTFKKIDKITFLGNPELPLKIVKMDNPDYSVEEIGIHSIVVKREELTRYFAFFTHANPSVVANAMKRFLRSKIADNGSDSLSGQFEFQVTPNTIHQDDFLKFLTLYAIEEEKNSPYAMAWQERTGRKIKVNIKHGDKEYLTEFQTEKSASQEKQQPEAPAKSDSKYATATVEELNNAFNRIVSIPNARTNIAALTDMAELIAEYEKRGIEMPNARADAKPIQQNKPWWKFW